MDINSALKVFQFDSIFNIKAEDVHKRYRYLMKKNHPDLGGSEDTAKKINEANEVLTKALSDLEKAKVYEQTTNITVFINFDSLLKIYAGGTVKVGSSGKSLDVNKENINKFDVILDTTVKADINGETYTYNRLEKKTHADNYSINVKYYVSELWENTHIVLYAYGKRVEFNATQAKMSLNLVYDFGVKLTVVFERQLIVDE